MRPPGPSDFSFLHLKKSWVVPIPPKFANTATLKAHTALQQPPFPFHYLPSYSIKEGLCLLALLGGRYSAGGPGRRSQGRPHAAELPRRQETRNTVNAPLGVPQHPSLFSHSSAQETAPTPELQHPGYSATPNPRFARQ